MEERGEHSWLDLARFLVTTLFFSLSYHNWFGVLVETMNLEVHQIVSLSLLFCCRCLWPRNSFTNFGLNFAYPQVFFFQFPRNLLVGSSKLWAFAPFGYCSLIPSQSYIYEHDVCVLELQIETWTVLVAIVCILVFTVKEFVMGGKNSRESGRRYEFGASSSSWDNNDNYGGYPPQSPYPSSYQTPRHHHASASTPFYDNAQPKRKLDKKYSRIADNYRSLDEVIGSLHVTVLCGFLISHHQLFHLLSSACCHYHSLLCCWMLQLTTLT